ncbi:putative linoleate 9S-lipoxygenase 5 [Sesbania bispinosa]|nr:putative linoleate 9S-lipoxygenase 5 [Sesbania bispinosa]
MLPMLMVLEVDPSGVGVAAKTLESAVTATNACIVAVTTVDLAGFLHWLLFLLLGGSYPRKIVICIEGGRVTMQFVAFVFGKDVLSLEMIKERLNLFAGALVIRVVLLKESLLEVRPDFCGGGGIIDAGSDLLGKGIDDPRRNDTVVANQRSIIFISFRWFRKIAIDKNNLVATNKSEVHCVIPRIEVISFQWMRYDLKTRVIRRSDMIGRRNISHRDIKEMKRNWRRE